MAEWEDYVIGESNVLKNKFNITSQEELTEIENKIVVSKLSALYVDNLIGNFDEKHLCAIHKYLFGDIYDFAGKYREVNIYKTTGFFDYREIPERLKAMREEMNNYHIDISNKFSIAQYLGDYYYKLIMIHPFREGNGRTSREFIRELVAVKFPEYKLDYKKINSQNFQIGIIERKNYPMLLAYEIYNALVPNIKKKIK